MSFGFGIGDIITCINVAWKTVDALRTAGTEFEGLRLELSSLTSVLHGLEAEADGPMPLINSATPERQQQMRHLLRNCTASMEDLQSLVAKYVGMYPNTRRGFATWMKFAAKDKRSPREKLAVHTASINIFLTTLSHGSLARLEFLIKNGPQVMAPASGSGVVRDFGQEGPGDFFSTNVKKRTSAFWQYFGSSLADEGISQSRIETFETELKAYVRYLVRGEIPFWGNRDVETMIRNSESERKSSALLEARSERHRLWELNSVSPSATADVRRAEVEAARELEQARRERLRDEVRVALELREIESEVKRKDAWQRKRDSDKETPRLERSRAKEPSLHEDEKEVLELAGQFESLFDFQGPPRDSQLLSNPPGTRYDDSYPAQEDSEGVEDFEGAAAGESQRAAEQRLIQETLRREEEQQRRKDRVVAIRKRIEEFRSKYIRYVDHGKSAKARDLKDHAVPLQIELLEGQGVTVLNSRDWQRGYACDTCHFWIPGPRYHCGKCRGSSGESSREGNWDVCEECWNTGARCLGGEEHIMVLIDE